MHSSPVLDCTVEAAATIGSDYSVTYEHFISTFHFLAHSQVEVECINVPKCWVPMILYLGHKVETVEQVKGINWDADFIDWHGVYIYANDKRFVVEMASVGRPELVHALFMVDNEWPCPLLESYGPQEYFPVTNNGSFFRPEVMEYFDKLFTEFQPPADNVIITPCFADKPYPSRLQQHILDRIDRTKWYIASATGVLGVCPEPLWDVAPKYDSGVPNLERCEKIMRWFFQTYKHKNIIVYSDFYAPAISQAWRVAGGCSRGRAQFIFGDHYRTSYEPLDFPMHLATLFSTVTRMQERDEEE